MEKRWKDGDSDIGMRAMNDERRTSRRLRTTMSAHRVVFPSISSFWLHSNFSFSVLFFVFSLCYYFLACLLFLSVCFFPSTFSQHTFILSVSTAVSLQLHICSFDQPVLSLPDFSSCLQLRAYSYGIYCMYKFKVRIVKISVN